MMLIVIWPGAGLERHRRALSKLGERQGYRPSILTRTNNLQLRKDSPRMSALCAYSHIHWHVSVAQESVLREPRQLQSYDLHLSK